MPYKVITTPGVFKTLYSSHEKVLEKSNWAFNFKVLTGRFTDKDFEPSLEAILGTQEIKKEADRKKL